MVSVNLQNKIYQSSINSTRVENNNSTKNTALAQNPISSKQPSFNAALAPVTLRTELSTNEEKEKYSQVASALDSKDKKKLDVLLKNGILLNTDSNDKSSTLDNLYKIITIPRAEGLEPNVVLKETVRTIANPFIITQNFGDIPNEFLNKALEVGRANNIKSKQPSEDNPNQSSLPDEITPKSINITHSSDCVSASIEFNLAQKMPAEFARFTEELSSPKLSVEKTIQIKNLTDNALDSVWLLNAFEVPYKMDDFNTAKLTLAPDKNALIRAQIQNSYKDGKERSLVDVLMQSTFMNVGSEQTFNSLTDNRAGKFSANQNGLVEFEKTFTESIVLDKNKTSVTYQILDDDKKLIGYETDLQTMKKHILDSLAMGENVIIGYTDVDSSNKVINGHEITIIGAKQDKNGKTIFICNDTDDNLPFSIKYPEDYILPKIHHAGLPQKVVANDEKFVDSWVEGINQYKAAKNQS